MLNQGLFQLIWQSVQAIQELVSFPNAIGQTRSGLTEEEIEVWVVMVRPWLVFFFILVKEEIDYPR